MRDDFEPIVYNFQENKDIKIYPISDLHVGARESMTRAWEQFVKRIKTEPNSYITIGGDMTNNGIKSSVTNIYEEVMRPRDQKQYLSEQLRDIKDKILCVVPGNHESRSNKEVDDNPLYDVCCKLDIEDRFRENAAFVLLRMGNIKGDGTRNPSYSICVQHGKGGGIYTGASVNRNERFGYTIDGLDVLIVGHSHKPVISRPQKITIDSRNKKVSFRQFTVVTSTSWLQFGGYALQAQMLPASHSLQEVLLSGSEKKVRVLF